ncbi:acetoin utilization deacetylase AcuC-like enzyme [Prosthecobacter fusiformis]|uniref:Acetoin utilization deacetylase AcuC-like enzyme n=1 Tax=Prosthecobacter fusiformis TaxID=48464 RepID=A0A4R7RL13_9BACT|nr:histone deacetylase [Prosthecobacter fusiformis]TDU64123.1 acetoin utilization deacetylase AcuC-like enzyme [Prosthecobacter fusiformis]
MTTGIHLQSIYTDHDPGPGHPESPSRYTAITQALTASGLLPRLTPIPGRHAEIPEIQLCHPRHYIELVRDEVAAGLDTLSTGDTQISDKSYAVATHAVGSVLDAVDLVMTGQLQRAFCAVRPPGHHARPSQGMGFCLFNNIAIGARHAQKKHGAAKVLIVDWDVHHGNGTQDIFYDDATVLFASTHQSPWYPFTGRADETGAGKGQGTTLNFPLPAGSGMKEIRPIFQDRLLPAIARFQPDLIMISAGFDSRINDPLGQFHLTDDDFAHLTRLLQQAAAEHCQGRLISILEGGYSLPGLATAVTAHVTAMLE